MQRGGSAEVELELSQRVVGIDSYIANAVEAKAFVGDPKKRITRGMDDKNSAGQQLGFCE